MRREHAVVFSILGAALIVLGLGKVARAGQLTSLQRASNSAIRAAQGWSSGWVDIGPGETLTFTHNLGGDPGLYAVHLWFRDTGGLNYGVNHRAYGSLEANGVSYGAYWWGLTDSLIRLTRQNGDHFADQVYLRIWQPDPPDWDSGWVDIAPGSNNALLLSHNLGGDVDDYTVGIKFQDTDSGGLGIHQFAIGGYEDSNLYYGAAWSSLDDTSLEVVRFEDDPYVDQVRLFITRPIPPTYDSGWVTIPSGARTVLTHNLGINLNLYVVRVTFRSSQNGENILGVGGMEAASQFFGTNWENLTESTIDLWRRPDDTFSEEARVRIWTPYLIFLPLLTR